MRFGARKPVKILCDKAFYFHIFFHRERDSIVFGIFFFNVHGLRQSEPQTLALTYGIADYALVLTENFSAFVNKFAARIIFACGSFDKCGIVAVRYKTNILALMLLRIYKVVFFGK